MSEEKIAFLYPVSEDEDGKKIPILQYEVSEVPAKISMTIKISMVGIIQEHEYQISANVFSQGGANLTEDTGWLHFKANDPGDPTDLAAVTLEAKFHAVEFDTYGNHRISATLKDGDKTLSEAVCYFKLRKPYASKA